MNHFRHSGMEREKAWTKATYKLQKADSSLLPRPFSMLTALLTFYLLRRRTQYEKHEEIAGAYIQYLKARILVYAHITRTGRRKARDKSSLARDTLQAKITVQECHKCDSKKVLDSLKIIIREGKVEYECRTCPSTSQNREEQEEKRKRQRKTRKQRGADLNYYRRLLGLVGKELTKDRIEKAYRDKVKECHPDAGGDREEFKQVKEAKEELNKYAVVN